MILAKHLSQYVYKLGRHYKVTWQIFPPPLLRSFTQVRSYSFKNLECYRSKHTVNLGVKGIKKQRFNETIHSADSDSNENEEINIEDSEYDSVANLAMNVVRKNKADQNVMVIQPYIKWGPQKLDTKPNLQLLEAESLIRSLPSWNVILSLTVPLESLEKKQFFGKGKLEELKTLIKQSHLLGNKITCIFISKGVLNFAQKQFLETEFEIPVMDRYSVVIQILRLHATSSEAKLQVAMAEIPYIWGQNKEINLSTSRKQGFYLSDLQKQFLQKRERKLKLELEKIRTHRKLLRKKRRQMEFPIVAIIGYTNSGKTSLIKALTNEQTIQPRNQLFATLDVTAHTGLLPCKLEVIYMDTVGFMSDIPTGLIECFIATLEDAMIADVIIHVQDLSHDNYIQQKLHVETTLQSLISAMDNNQNISISPEKVINVGNKVDLVKDMENFTNIENLNLISSKTFTGIFELVKEIESRILDLTNRKKITMRIKNGGQEMAWLHKNSAVITSQADPNNEERLLLDVVISNANLQIFKHKFIVKK